MEGLIGLCNSGLQNIPHILPGGEGEGEQEGRRGKSRQTCVCMYATHCTCVLCKVV